jgi:hypothetical protein
MKAGWLPVQINDELIDWIFIFPEDYWRNLEIERKKTANELNLTTNIEGKTDAIMRDNPVSTLFFFFILTICISFLWLEPRLN